MKKLLLFSVLALLGQRILAQDSLKYQVHLTPVKINGLPGLHSYAYAQHDGKWLIIGGRRDGLHPRQPFRSFPETQNNKDIYVVDVAQRKMWSVNVSSLSTAVAEQLQSTNMNFHQLEDTLFIIGGYGYSTTATDHITYPNLTTINVSGLINAVINSQPISSYIKQVSNKSFAVTGGHLAYLADTFYLVGGHRFDGRYNPMGNNTYTQTYTNQIRKFTINNANTQPGFVEHTPITDAVHLRRRDYNLLPQVFPDRSEGFTISSGVFQQNVDLPFLYPVDITAKGHSPQTTFNQYLSNYHCATTSLYDSVNNVMHMLFYGGISQYYYENGSLVKDDNVPFVNTISSVSRGPNGILKEYELPNRMPNLIGASAEFLLNEDIPHTKADIIKLHTFNKDTILIGHILGGISSTSRNPFVANQTENTVADENIYEVRLIKGNATNIKPIKGSHEYNVDVYPNPADNYINITLSQEQFTSAYYYLTNMGGQLLQHGELTNKQGNSKFRVSFENKIEPQQIHLTVVIDDKYFISKPVFIK